MDWLRHEISDLGIRPSKKKTERIRSLIAPTNVKGLRQVLGIVNYYGRYIPNLAELAHPLFERLKKEREWKWGTTEENTLDRIKEEICLEDTLAIFDSNVTTKTYLTCDASENGMGAVLEQEVIEKSPLERRPIFYWLSRFRE